MTAEVSRRHPSNRVTMTLDLPALDDAAAAIIYNVLCELVDRFDDHYGEQICRFYAQHDDTNTTRNSVGLTDDPPF